MGLLLLSRLIFLITNHSQLNTADGSEILRALLVGFRFDFATALITITLPLLPLWIPLPWPVRKRVLTLSTTLSVIFFILISAFLWGDLFFYFEANRHLTLEPFGIITDFRSVFRMIVEEYLLASCLLIVFLVGISWWVLRLFNWSRKCESDVGGWGWKRVTLWIPLVLITFIGIRGGVQKEPLKSADAVIGSSPFLANLALNGWYSFLTEATKDQRPVKLMPEEESIAVVRELIRRDDDRFLDNFPAASVEDSAAIKPPKYPLLRISPATGKITRDGEKLNLVLIVVESLNADFLQSFGGADSAMPFLDSLARQSVIFTNFQAVGTRSFRGLCALLAAYPNLGSDAYHLTFTLPRLTGLGGILTSEGYAARFMHGAPINSMGVTAICRMSGYPEFVSLEDFPKSADNGSWGAWDHLALQRMAQDMDQMPEPFHYGIFTLCTHAPWALPEEYSPRFPEDAPRADILNTFSYFDDALRDFFAKESKQPRFSRTLYLIVGDHTTHASEVERFRVGCIFYAPGRLEHRVENRLTSQLDILPSLLDLLGVEAPHSSFGSSLFSLPRRPEWAVLLQSNFLYWREGSRVLESGLTRTISLHDPLDRSSDPHDYLSTESARAAEMNQKLIAFYEVSEILSRENRFTNAQILR